MILNESDYKAKMKRSIELLDKEETGIISPDELTELENLLLELENYEIGEL
jgi:hypothetical protein